MTEEKKEKKEKRVYSLPPDKIFVPANRIRRKFDEKYLESLAESIRENEQIQPGVCTKEEDGSFTLVAGECRLRACKIAGVDYQFTLRDETDPQILRRIELEENIRRKDISLHEELMAKEELLSNLQDELGQPRPGRGGGGFGEKKYAEYLNESVGKTHEDLEIALFMKEIPEVAEAKNRAEAKKIIKRIKEDYNRHTMLEEAKGKLSVFELGLREGIDTGEAGDTGEETVPGKEGEETTVDPLALAVAAATARIHLARMEDYLQEKEDGTYNLVFFDPPWRVSFDEVRKKSGSTMDYQDGSLSPSEFKAELTLWLDLLYRKMHENSHLYLFFGIRNETIQEEEEEDLGLGLVYSSLENAGFKTNRMPLIWWKQGARVTRNPKIWPGRSYEPIAYARKGQKDLMLMGGPDVLPTPMPTPTMKQSHPSAKHPQIYLDLLKRSAAPGDKVIDPMCGSGMLGVAADILQHTHALDWEMVEMLEDFYNLSVTNVVKGYSRVVGATQEAVARVDYSEWADRAPKSFEGILPGSEQWNKYWDGHHNEREAMLAAWREEDETGWMSFCQDLVARGLMKKGRLL